jgi:hypothetical protein
MGPRDDVPRNSVFMTKLDDMQPHSTSTSDEGEPTSADMMAKPAWRSAPACPSRRDTSGAERFQPQHGWKPGVPTGTTERHFGKIAVHPVSSRYSSTHGYLRELPGALLEALTPRGISRMTHNIHANQQKPPPRGAEHCLKWPKKTTPGDQLDQTRDQARRLDATKSTEHDLGGDAA